MKASVEDDDVFMNDSITDCTNTSLDVSLSIYLNNQTAQSSNNISRYVVLDL